MLMGFSCYSEVPWSPAPWCGWCPTTAFMFLWCLPPLACSVPPTILEHRFRAHKPRAQSLAEIGVKTWEQRSKFGTLEAEIRVWGEWFGLELKGFILGVWD